MDITPIVPEKFHQEFPYLKDTRLDHRLVGYPAILNSFCHCVSSSRLDMYASHRNQALVIKRSEFPDIFSGYEKEDGKYTFNSTRRDQDIVILDLIHRYSDMPGVPGSATPYITVVYKGLEDNEVGYFNIEKYFLGSDGFGFTYNWGNVGSLGVGDYVAKDEVIACSPNIKGSEYNIGLNLTTAFISTHEVIEDAMWISRSAAEAMESEEFRKIIVNISQDVRPLYINGTPDNPKIFPDIGEKIRPDGAVAAFRNVSTTTCMADTDPSTMHEINLLTDDAIIVRPGGEVVNLEFVVAKPRLNPAYSQVEKYHKASLDYYRRIYDSYHSKVLNQYRLTPTYNKLVTQAITRLSGAGIRLPGYNDNIRGRTEYEGMDRQTVEYIQAIITIRRPRKVEVGFKLSCQSGGRPNVG